MGTNSESFRFFFASPTLVIDAALRMLEADRQLLTAFFAGDMANAPTSGLLWNTSITATHAVAGFVIGNLLGTALGVGLWYLPTIAMIARPYLVALGALPVFAIAPMTILWFGVGFGAKVALATLAVVFLAASQAFKGAEEVDPLLLRRMKIYGASNRHIFFRLLLPSSLVWIISSLRLTVGAALLGSFVGEFIASDQGIGRVIIRAGGLYDTPTVLVGVFSMVAIAVGLDKLIVKLESHLYRWKKEG
jgi:NitT/TauT family transport system permease protein